MRRVEIGGMEYLINAAVMDHRRSIRSVYNSGEERRNTVHPIPTCVSPRLTLPTAPRLLSSI